MLRDKDSSYADFKIGFKDRDHLVMQNYKTMWPTGTVVINITSNCEYTSSIIINSTYTVLNESVIDSQQLKPESLKSQSTPLRSNTTRANLSGERHRVRISFDREAISACKFFAFQNSDFIINNNTKYYMPELYPMVPPIVRLPQDWYAANDGIYWQYYENLPF